MRCVLVPSLVLVIMAPAQAQWWVDAGIPVNQAHGVTELYEDTANGTLYCLGHLEQVDIPGYQTFHFCTYRDGDWAVSDPFNHIVYTAINYRDTLIVGGVFSNVNGLPIEHIAAFYAGEWHAYGSIDGTVRSLRILNGDLYALGYFDTADGVWCGGVAKRVGNSWVNIGNLAADQSAVLDALFYDGKLVIAGTITITGETYRHVLQFDGEEWVPLGPGILGNIGGASSLAIYQGDLYVGGVIDINSGNAGHAIMRWDGEQFHPVGTGVQDLYGGYNYPAAIHELKVKDGLLFACGGFEYAGNVPANFVATWDGDRWCGVGGTLDPQLGAIGMGFFGDTLFVGSGNVADGQAVNKLVRFIGEDFRDTCSVSMGPFVGIAQPRSSPAVELVALGHGQYRFDGIAVGSRAELNVYNGMGQLVRVVPGVEASEPFSLSGLHAGTYVLELMGIRAKLAIISGP